jgi:hypothetical protein
LKKTTKKEIKIISVLITSFFQDRYRWRNLVNRPIKPPSSTKFREFFDKPETY